MATISDYIKLAKKLDFSLTKYLDTTESSELRKIKDPSLEIFYNGGYEDAERLRAIIIKKGEIKPSDEEFEIGVIKVVPKSDIKEITHRHVLGTLMSFGIKRDVVGDILINDNEIYIFTTKDMENFIKENLYKINGVGVDTYIANTTDINYVEKSKEQLINIPSLRLDAVISKVLNISRNDSTELINKGLVQVNHIECNNVSYFLKMDDLLSIKHFGRVLIKEIDHTTKKDRLVLRIIVC